LTLTPEFAFTDATPIKFEVPTAMSRKTKKGNYRVGYAKPPVHTRFKPGESGNPSGRPTGKPSLASAVEQALSESVVVIEHRRRKRLTKLEATARQLANKCAAGDLRAVSLIAAMTRAGEAPSGQETNETAALAGADQEEPVDFVHGNRIPPVKGKPRSDGRDLLDIIDEIYRIGEYAPKAPVKPTASIGPPNRGSAPAKDGDKIEQDRRQDWVHNEDVSRRI
jgi:hypothetical protein